MNFDENKQNIDEESNQEDIEDVSVESSVNENQKKKTGFLSGLKKVAAIGIDMAKTGVEKGIDITKEGYSKAKDKHEQSKLNKEELKKYQETYAKKTYLFEIKGSFNSKGILETIRAFRDIDKQMLYIPLVEENIRFVKSKTNLINTSDASEIEIEYIEMKDVSLREMVFDGNIKYDVQCYQAKYNYVKTQTSSSITNISNVVNQNVNVSGQNTGEINLISNIEVELDNLMNEVKGIKTKMFSKEKRAQDDAIKIIGPVKDTIINGEKDKTLMQRFFDLLVAFAPVLAEAFKAFM